MNRHDLIVRLLELPAAIAAAETALLQAEWERDQAERQLRDAEDRLLLDGETLTGRNAETRAAQMREQTYQERRYLVEREQALALRRVELRQLTNELGCLKSVARLLEASP